ncbi:hypothetical protein VO63_28980 [Streptomyces showdoensis]|uniref:STAS domain-containing protein n=1 Tax=Streptomyces showdoensis TaxID=68268 RepID=A0A2P2GG12_STREW|nr:hypothetical protein VO63_28980 [Streptomyces showdoensis]
MRASGEFDMESVSGLVQALADARDEGATRVMLDLSGVTFGDSTFLNVLIRTHRSGELVLVGDSPRHLRKLFELTGTEHLFRHVRTS